MQAMENLGPEDHETIREFLVESYESLSRLDLDLVELEKRPKDINLLGSVFRAFHTTFSTLEGFCKVDDGADHLENELLPSKQSFEQAKDGGLS